METSSMNVQTDPAMEQKIAQRLAELNRFLQRGGSMSILHGISAEQLITLYGSAYACLEERDFQGARNLFTLLVHADHWNVEYWLGLGISQQRLGDHQSALAAFAYVESLAVQDPRSRLYAALSYQIIGERERAANSIASCLMWCGTDPDYREVREEAQKYASSQPET